MNYPEFVEQYNDNTETKTIALIGHLVNSMGAPYKVGLRFTDDPGTLHSVLHMRLDEVSALEVRMLERGDQCEVVWQSNGGREWNIRKIRFVPPAKAA